MRSPRKALSIAAVGLLHVAIVAVLLRAIIVAPSPKPPREETVMMLPLAPPPLPERSSAQAPAKGVERQGLAVVSPATPNHFVSPTPQASGLGQTLFGCQPENLRNLSREQQEKCVKLSGGRYVAMKNGLPVYTKPPGPEWEGLRNSDIRARERNTADPCLAAKATGTDCIHEILFGKGLW